MRQQIACHKLLAWDWHGMTFRYSWSLFAWGREHCCPHSSLAGVVGDTQKRTEKEGRTHFSSTGMCITWRGPFFCFAVLDMMVVCLGMHVFQLGWLATLLTDAFLLLCMYIICLWCAGDLCSARIGHKLHDDATAQKLWRAHVHRWTR